MSTPSSHPVPQPSSASKKAAHNIGTPHTTTPRSVPSPAATRKEQSGKTPVNHPTASSSHGSKTLASTPMMHSLSQSGTGLGSSPGQGHFGTPGSSALHGLGVEMGSGLTPNLNGGIPTPILQQAMGAGMVPSVSEIMGTSRKRNEDEDRKAKMSSILRKIGKSTGRITIDGIQRIAKRVGLNAPPYDESASEIVMAGPAEKMMLVVKMQGDIVRSVAPDIFICESEKEKEEQVMGLAASNVLKQDLTATNGILLQSSLEKFATSLDRLARMDRLSKGQVDCFEAINGLHTSLKKLYELEKDAVKALRRLKGSDADYRVEHEVLRKRSGRPSIHGNGKIGLSLDYWTPNVFARDDSESAMDVDGGHETKQDADASSEVWSLRIEAESCSAGMYPSLRVSDAWLPETFELPPAETPPIIPWQDPPNTLISTDAAAASSDAMAIDGSGRLPDLRFVAKLDPPILLPLQIAANILASLGDQYSQNPMFPIYHFHLLGSKSQEDITNVVMSEQTVLLQDYKTENLHEYCLEVPKADLCYELQEVPFSHPRQLVELLPTLRQWASVSRLLRGTFAHNARTTHFNTSRIWKGDQRLYVDGKVDDASLAALLSEIGDRTKQEKVRVDIAFASNSSNLGSDTAVPSFSLAYSATTEDGKNVVVFQVLPNGEILVSDLGGEEAEKKSMHAAQALYKLEDIGLWVEWLRASRGA